MLDTTISTAMKASTAAVTLSSAQREQLLLTLKTRFAQHAHRHVTLTWAEVHARLLQASTAKLRSLYLMEATDGEPDVTGCDSQTGEILFMDCASQSPKGRYSLCYDDAALAARKLHKPKGSAMGMAQDMGVEILGEEHYLVLQKLGEFDTKTSSWIQTPEEMRKLGGALFGDRRFGRVFFYHNGAESYYSGRGFRSMLRI